MTTSTDDNAFDMEALQAQIDVTMAYAHELASSWINPSLKSSGKSSRDFEKELDEYMRRPPRLGVGAPIPETAHTHRDAARLKSHLTKKGKQRARDGDEKTIHHKSSDEEDSRAGAIKKKSKVEAPSVLQKGKKRAREGDNKATNDSSDDEESRAGVIKKKLKVEVSGASRRDGKKHEGTLSVHESSLGRVTTEQSPERKDFTIGTHENGKLTKKQRRRLKRNKLAGMTNEPLATSISASYQFRESASASSSGDRIELEGQQPSPVIKPGTLPGVGKLLVTTPVIFRSPPYEKTLSPLAPQFPVLNLDGPPKSPDGGEPCTRDSRSKKRRTRHKRRKSSQVKASTEISEPSI